jgi:acetylornithine deacetylase
MTPGPSSPSIDREFVTNTLVDLVRINSINPSLVPGAPGESEIAAHVARLLEGLGLAVSVHEAAAGRPSVVGVLRGTGHGRRLMLNGHLDTVGVEGMDEPFSGRVENGRVYGRGSQDMKGSLTACFAAVKALVDSGTRLAGDVVVAAVADEEHASIGTADIATRVPVDGAIVTEPTDLEVCTAHKGFVWVEVKTHGVAAHGSRFQDGIDANLRMGRFLHELDRLEQSLRARSPHPLVGPPSLHAATIAGGTGLSTYSASCKLEIERRTIPGETEGQVLAELTELTDRLARADPTFRATVTSLFARDSFEARADSPLAEAVDRAAKAVLGTVPKRLGKSGWMDSALLAAAGADTLVFGPSGAGLHGAVEWVDLESVVKASAVLAATAIEYCA